MIDLLAIVPHPDDAELLCGGTLIRAADQGYKTGVLDLSAGELGSRGTAEQRGAEAKRAAQVLGLTTRRVLGLPDARIRNDEEGRTRLVEAIRQLEPRTVILPYFEGRHPDHPAAAELGYDACYLSGLKNFPADGEPHRPTKILYALAYREHAVKRGPRARRIDARWCRGSTSAFGAEIPGSNPGRAATRLHLFRFYSCVARSPRCSVSAHQAHLASGRRPSRL